MAGDPRLVAGAMTLLSQLEKRWPERTKDLDGWLADGIHQPNNSDHYPDANNVVHAIDIDIRFIPENYNESRAFANVFADELIKYVRLAVPGSERIKYVVFNKKIASGKFRDRFWVWREGNFGCTNHIHIAFTNIGESDPRRFTLPSLSIPSAVKASNIQQPPLKIERNTIPEFPGKDRLKFGQQNESIRRLQGQLAAKNYLVNSFHATGNYDTDTAHGVRMLYHDMRKSSDGLSVGPAAWNFLFGG